MSVGRDLSRSSPFCTSGRTTLNCASIFFAVVVASGFQREESMIQRADRIFDLVEIHAEGAVSIRDERAFVEKVIELDGHTFGVGILQSKTQRAERGSEISRIKLMLGCWAMRQR